MNIKEAINKSLFFFGAGASYDAKCKLSNDMLWDLKERITKKTDNSFNRPEKDALKFLLSCLEYHGEWRTLESYGNFKFMPNIEELALLIRRVKNREHFLPYPITGNWADKLPVLEAEFQDLPATDKARETLFDALEFKIKSILLPEWLTPQGYDFLNPLKDFFQHYPNEDFRLNIFSLNVDMVIENYFTSNNIRPWRGFVSGEWRGADYAENLNDFGRINLYKLHGSLDWVRLITGDFRENRNQLPHEDLDSIEPGHDPYVIFGQGTKTFSVEPFFNLVQHLKKQLAEKSYFFVIGYSFFDPYINNLLIEAVKETSKKIIIVNPSFGPEAIKFDGKFQTEGNFLKIKYPDDKSTLDLATYIEDIQRNSFYSELPEFNIKRVNAKAIDFLPVGTSTFFDKYFQAGAQTFIDLIKEYEDERTAAEEPF